MTFDEFLGTLYASSIIVWAGALGHIYTTMGRDRAEAQAVMRDQFQKLWTTIAELQKDIAADRSMASRDRIAIAERMVTKEDLARHEAHIVHEMDLRLPPKGTSD